LFLEEGIDLAVTALVNLRHGEVHELLCREVLLDRFLLLVPVGRPASFASRRRGRLHTVRALLRILPRAKLAVLVRDEAVARDEVRLLHRAAPVRRDVRLVGRALVRHELPLHHHRLPLVRVELALHRLVAHRILRVVGLRYARLHLVAERTLVDLKVRRLWRARAAGVTVVRVDVVVLDDALYVDVVNVAALAVLALCGLALTFLRLRRHVRGVAHALVLHLLVHQLLVVGGREHALVEDLRILHLALVQRFVDLCSVELRDYNILIILWLRLGDLI
jgi:hypothetical protein